MKTIFKLILLVCCTILLFTACKKDAQKLVTIDEISSTALFQIEKLGFNTQGLKKAKGGYIVEGDIFLADTNLFETPSSPNIILAQEEQYRTFNLVNPAKYPKIKIGFGKTSSPKQKVFSAALHEVIKRYNALGLSIKMQHAGSKPHIAITPYFEAGNTLAYAGFPTSDGAPHNSIMINTYHFSTSTNENNINYIATILAHEIGHCIGFRHTDYMNRAFSCSGDDFHEGETANGIGAVHIPGTPVTANANSWMLACIASGVNRPFNSNDLTALNYVY